MSFEPFPKLFRLFRNIVVTEKIDGTNAQVIVPDDPAEPVLFGSRTRLIKPGDDNYGFATWGTERAEKLREVLGPGRHFGEWWGQGIQRNYGLKEKRFSLFNTVRWKGTVFPEDLRMGTVPELYNGIFDEGVIRGMAAHIEHYGSIAAPGFMKPEGIVVFHAPSNQGFKYTLGGDGHKGT